MELTHTSPALYTGAQKVITVGDNCEAKIAETYFGTPDGLMRVLDKVAAETLAAQDRHYPFGQSQIDNYLFRHDKNFVVFGYGQVGQGIAHAFSRKLSSTLSPTRSNRAMAQERKRIVVIETDVAKCRLAEEEGFSAILLSNTNKPAIKEKLGNSFCAVTATGVEGAVSQYFTAADFPPGVGCYNMGTPDEWGPGFAGRVWNEGRPANFALGEAEGYPTQVSYLELPFTVLAQAGEAFVSDDHSAALHAGLNRCPVDYDRKWLAAWFRHNPQFQLEYSLHLAKLEKLKKQQASFTSPPSSPFQATPSMSSPTSSPWGSPSTPTRRSSRRRAGSGRALNFGGGAAGAAGVAGVSPTLFDFGSNTDEGTPPLTSDDDFFGFNFGQDS